MRTSRPTLALGFVLVFSACGGASTDAPRTSTPRVRVDHTDARSTDADPPVEVRSARALGADATFGDLVRAARTLEDRGDDGASAGCLLRGTGAAGAPWRLEADVAIAVRPLPAAWDDYDAQLRAHPGPARLFSRWGATYAESYALALVTFTGTVPVDPTRASAAVVLTDEGAYVLGTNESGLGAHSALPPARIDEALLALQADGPPALVAVTAEAGLPLGSLREALALLTALGVPVALAAPLAPDVRLPAERAVAPDVAERGLCERGLPEPPTDATEGELAPTVIVHALLPLRTAAARCLAVASGRAASGGRLDVTLRIAANGTVSEACALSDALHDPALRLCVLEAARALRLPTPSPAGYVDVVLPLMLVADASLAQRPLCE